MDPINYVSQMNDPTGSVMAGYNQGLDQQAARQNMQVQSDQVAIQQDANARANEMQPYQVQGAQLGLDAQRQNMAAQAQQMQMQRDQAARREQFQADMGALADLGGSATVQDFARIQTQYPELGQGVMRTFEAMDEPRQRNTASIIAQGAYALKNGDTEQAVTLLTQYAEAAEASGDSAGAASARAVLEVAKVNPDAALASAGIALHSISPELAGKVFDMGDTATVSRSEMVGPTLSVQTMNDGTTRVVDTTTNEPLQGDAARQAIETARASEVENQRLINEGRATGRLDAEIDQGGIAKATEALGGLQARFVESAFEGASQIATGLSNIQSAITAIDNGARSGVVDKYLPNISEESAALRNAMDRMGLDVVGSVTFGALSASELNLAMETAAPRNLNEQELRSWLVERLDAQRKVRAALIEQAQFLSDPQNSLNDWAQMVGGEPDATGQPATPQQAPQAAPSFLDLYGGGN